MQDCLGARRVGSTVPPNVFLSFRETVEDWEGLMQSSLHLLVAESLGGSGVGVPLHNGVGKCPETFVMIARFTTLREWARGNGCGTDRGVQTDTMPI